ncbi:MAG: glycosyltransferase [Acidobacteriia bacterium]|nr:glycosyltransferase [Terriglobia bacterium]
MRIGMLAPISNRIPPRQSGPWERAISLLTEGLVEYGLDVTLFATSDSLTRAQLHSVCPHPLSEDSTLDPRVWETLHMAAVFERASEFDLIHNYADFVPLAYCSLVKTPILTTLYKSASKQTLPILEKYNGRTRYIAISKADLKPQLNYLATIYHGIAPEDFTFQREPGDYLLCFGRIHPEKGTAEAIQVARRARQRLIIAGVISDMEYFKQVVAPHVDGEHVQYLGAVGPDRRNELLGGACALLHLINFDEPYGFSVIEAMACGTPVIAYGRGSVPELILHEETGFIVNSIQEAVGALESVRKLDREQVRLHVEQNFSRDRMVDEYIRVYMGMVNEEGKPATGPARAITVKDDPPAVKDDPVAGEEEVAAEPPRFLTNPAFAPTPSTQDQSSSGSFAVIDEGSGYKVRRIELLPGKRLSYRRHAQRSEQWTIVQGLGKVRIDGDDRLVRVGQKINVPIGAGHSMENFGDQLLVFIETQRGPYLGEDDVEHLKDEYGGVPEDL